MSDEANDIDDLILNLLAENNPRAATLMFEAHYKALYNSANKMIMNDKDAEDIVLQLFQAVWEKRHLLQIRKPIRSYLLVAAHNRATNHIIATQRDKTLLRDAIQLSATTRSVPSVEVEIEAQELDELIKAAIGMLPEKARITFTMSRELGLTYIEIAAKLNVTVKAVEKNMHKAIQLLRILLSSYLKLLLIFCLTG